MNPAPFLFHFFFLSTTAWQIAAAETLQGRVVAVEDGDTITVLDASRQQHNTRLAGIDAPESKQAFGSRSNQNLSKWVFNREVTVEWHKRDRYGRTVGVDFTFLESGYKRKSS